MNPTQTPSPGISNDNLFKNIENITEFEQAEPDNTEVTYTEAHKQEISNNWADFYNLRTEDLKQTAVETPVVQMELTERRVLENLEISQNQNFHQNEFKDMFTPEDNLKGSGSSLEEAGFKLNVGSAGKEIGKGLFGALAIFGEIFMDTLDIVKPKKAKRKEKAETDPVKAQKAAEKKAENMKKQNNIKAFYEGLKAQVGAAPNADAARMDAAEKENINKTAKIGQESYKGIKDSFGRITVYASSMFEIATKSQEKQAKKMEKEQKIASAGGAPDMNMDKVAEGGFLSSTGGQGAG